MNKKTKLVPEEGSTGEHRGSGAPRGRGKKAHETPKNSPDARFAGYPGYPVTYTLPMPPVPPAVRPDMRTPEQRIQEFMEWAERHPRDIPLLSEEAISRDSIY